MLKEIVKELLKYLSDKETEVYYATTKFEEIYQGSTKVLEANKNIIFQDDVVKEILVKDLKLDINGDGEINYKEAAACQSLVYPAGTKYTASGYSGKSPFFENTSIETFNEFKYFVGITSLKISFDLDNKADIIKGSENSSTPNFNSLQINSFSGCTRTIFTRKYNIFRKP